MKKLVFQSFHYYKRHKNAFRSKNDFEEYSKYFLFKFFFKCKLRSSLMLMTNHEFKKFNSGTTSIHTCHFRLKSTPLVRAFAAVMCHLKSVVDRQVYGPSSSISFFISLIFRRFVSGNVWWLKSCFLVVLELLFCGFYECFVVVQKLLCGVL